MSLLVLALERSVHTPTHPSSSVLLASKDKMLPLCWGIPLCIWRVTCFSYKEKFSPLPLLVTVVSYYPVFLSHLRCLNPGLCSRPLSFLLPSGFPGCPGPQSCSLETKVMGVSSDAAVSGMVSTIILKRFLLRVTLNQSILPSCSTPFSHRGQLSSRHWFPPISWLTTPPPHWLPF